MKKICSNCKTEKRIEFFNKKSNSKDGYSSKCKECNKEYLKNHYLSNKDEYKKRNKLNRKKLKEWFHSFKSELKCIKCEEDRWWVLEFHHRESDKKEGHVYSILMSYGKKKFKKEVEKCDLLCANCHKDVHYNPN